MKLSQDLQNISQSFYSKEIYNKIFDKKFSIIRFLLVVACIYALAISYKGYYLVKSINLESPQSRLDKVLNTIVNQFPSVMIKDNKLLSSEESQPIYIKGKSGNPIIIIDSSGKINSLNNSQAYLLLSKRRLIYAPFEGYETTLDYTSLNPDNKTVLLNQEVIKSIFLAFQQNIFRFILTMIFPLMIMNVIWKICIKALILAAISFVYFKNNFKSLFKLFVIASVPILMIQAVYYIEPKLFVAPQIFLPLINICYLCFAINSVAIHLKKAVVK
jgi:hypothetical protein